MSLAAFLTSLFEHGRVVVEPPADVGPEARQAAAEVLADVARLTTPDFPGVPPEFDEQAALWAAELFYRACQLAVYRDYGEQNIAAGLSVACPRPPLPSTHYSVDLTWQFLPDLDRLSRQASPEDPLVRAIGRWGVDWPLSSVGIAGIAPSSLAGIVEHPGLLRLYADRIITRKDAGRLAVEEVRRAVAAALGIHSVLAPEIAAALSSIEAGAER